MGLAVGGGPAQPASQDIAIRRYAEREHHVVRWTEAERGGHFMALEAPDVLVPDVRAFFADLR